MQFGSAKWPLKATLSIYPVSITYIHCSPSNLFGLENVSIQTKITIHTRMKDKENKSALTINVCPEGDQKKEYLEFANQTSIQVNLDWINVHLVMHLLLQPMKDYPI